MAVQPRPNPRRRLGFIFAGSGIGVWLVGGAIFLGNVSGALPTIRSTGFVTSFVGAILEAVGVSFMRAPRFSWKRRTNLVVIVVALFLFSLVLLGATLSFGGNLEHPTTAGRWIGATVFLLVSTAIVFALSREVVLRFHDAVPPWEGHVWRFTPRWKDELACASSDGELVLGMSFEPHVFFPTDEAWALFHAMTRCLRR